MPSNNEKPQFSSDDLIIPIYIDTNALFDLLASVEGGFSVVEKVTARTSNSKTSDQSANANTGTEFGIPKILNLLKINLNGSLNRKQNQESREEKASERYHTYGSLFQRFRSTLQDDLVRVFDGSTEAWYKIEPHDFVELRGKFRLNPITDSFGTIDRLMGLYEIFAQAQYLFTEYLRDQSMTELQNKEYKLLGKVVDKISNPNDRIDLLQGTALSGFDEITITSLVDSLNQPSSGINLPKIETKVFAPALQVIPIAIYV